ncbi:MAG: MBL fold metallo-hydrolase RNA specificity domain-containing protein [Verrucomicrobiia bacterium]|jgi:2-phosphoglycerate kinase
MPETIHGAELFRRHAVITEQLCSAHYPLVLGMIVDNDEQKVDLLRLWNWVQHLGLSLVGLQPRIDVNGQTVAMDVQPGYHASGHAGGDELREFVRVVAPRELIPIHTDATRLWTRLVADQHIQVVIPQYAVPMTF